MMSESSHAAYPHGITLYLFTFVLPTLLYTVFTLQILILIILCRTYFHNPQSPIIRQPSYRGMLLAQLVVDRRDRLAWMRKQGEPGLIQCSCRSRSGINHNRISQGPHHLAVKSTMASCSLPAHEDEHDSQRSESHNWGHGAASCDNAWHNRDLPVLYSTAFYSTAFYSTAWPKCMHAPR